MNGANIIYKQNLRELEGASGVCPFIEATEGSLFFLLHRGFKIGSTVLDYIEAEQKHPRIRLDKIHAMYHSRQHGTACRKTKIFQRENNIMVMCVNLSNYQVQGCSTLFFFTTYLS